MSASAATHPVKGPEDLFAWLERHAIPVETHWHEPVFTVEEGRELKAALPGGHTKNLFLKDKGGALVLVAAHADSVLKLNALHRALATKRLSFASADLMEAVLGVTPGSVTAFALVNDTDGAVRFVADAELMRHDRLNFHPMTNTATTGIARPDFERFIAATGHELVKLDFTTL